MGDTTGSQASPGLIVGAVVGGLAALALVILGIYLVIRQHYQYRMRARSQREEIDLGFSDEDTDSAVVMNEKERDAGQQ